MTNEAAHYILENLQRIYTQYRELYSEDLIEANELAILALEKCIENESINNTKVTKFGYWGEGNRRQPCSVCAYRGNKSWAYCPACGAKMRSEK